MPNQCGTAKAFYNADEVQTKYLHYLKSTLLRTQVGYPLLKDFDYSNNFKFSFKNRVFSLDGCFFPIVTNNLSLKGD